MGIMFVTFQNDDFFWRGGGGGGRVQITWYKMISEQYL